MKNIYDDFELSERASTPEWFVTFSDMMSLLVALFVMIISFSEVKELERFHVVRDSLRGQFGHHAAGEAAHSGAAQPRQMQLAATLNAARSRRSQLMRGASPGGDGATETSGTFVTGGLDEQSDTLRR